MDKWKRSYYKHTILAYKIYNNAKICVKCYSTKNICVHHKNENPWDNREENLQILCKSCHNKHHLIWVHRTHSKKSRKQMSITHTGKKLSDITKNKLRISMLWRKKSLEAIKKKWKQVNQLTLDWDLINTWDSIKEASNILWIMQSWISNNCRWCRKTAWGFKWEYFNN